MLDPEDSAFLIALHAAAEGPQAERDLVSLLVRRLRAQGGRLHLAGLCWSSDTDQATSQPLPDVMTGLRLNRVYTQDELAATDAGDARALGLPLPDGRAAWIILTRARDPFRSIDTARLTAYAPHLQQALHLALRMAALTVQAQVQALVSRRLGIGVVHRDAAGGRLHLDGVARDLLAAANVSLHALARDWPKGPLHQGQVVTLATSLDMLVLDMGQGQIGLVRSQQMPLPPDHQIARALNITLSEARLARALAQGATLNQAALDLDLTTQTARFYSKQIFAKTGLSGQPALMRRIWTSALALAR